MSIIQGKENLLKIKSTFSKYSSSTNRIPNNKIRKFLSQLGFTSEIFFHDFYYYLPSIQKGGDLFYEDCIAFLDYILTPKKSQSQIYSAFQMFDRNGVGHISTTQLLNRLRVGLPTKDYQQYAPIILSYGSTINYIDIMQKYKNKF